jgi:hypothetical protein
MAAQVDKFYPVQGTNKYMTVSFPITKAFRIDFGAQTVGTIECHTFPKGSMVLGFSARVVEAMESGGAATLQLGFTGKHMLSSALGSGAATLGLILSPMGFTSNTANACPPYVLTANDTFDSIIASTYCTAGKVDVFVTYIPLPINDLTTTEFKQVVST